MEWKKESIMFKPDLKPGLVVNYCPKYMVWTKGRILRPDKQIIKPLSTQVQSYVPTESKGQYHAQHIVGQGRAGGKKTNCFNDFLCLKHMKRKSN